MEKLGKKELLALLSFGADQIFENQGQLPNDAGEYRMRWSQ